VRSTNGPLVAGVAAVAVLAVVAGGAVAATRGPKAQSSGQSAAPLPGSTPASTPTPSGSGQPSAKPAPVTTPPATPTPVAKPKPVQTTPPPTDVKITLSKLPKGRPPQVTYLAGRVLRGGGGPAVTIPGTENIGQAVRFGDQILVVLQQDQGGGELARMGAYDTGFASQRIAGVQSLVVTPDGRHVAYGTAKHSPGVGSVRGNAVYWETSDDVSGRRTLQRPSDWATRVLAVVGDTVYFESDTDSNGITSTLNAWQSRTGKVSRINVGGRPHRMNNGGTAAVHSAGGSPQNWCWAVADIETTLQQWKTCEYDLRGFTPSETVAIGTPTQTDGSGDPLIAAIDADDGEVLRQWTGAKFVHAVAEDDKHLLITAYEGRGALPLGRPPATDSAIIRCNIDTGACQLATPLARTPEARTGDLHLTGAWG